MTGVPGLKQTETDLLARIAVAEEEAEELREEKRQANYERNTRPGRGDASKRYRDVAGRLAIAEDELAGLQETLADVRREIAADDEAQAAADAERKRQALDALLALRAEDAALADQQAKALVETFERLATNGRQVVELRGGHPKMLVHPFGDPRALHPQSMRFRISDMLRARQLADWLEVSALTHHSDGVDLATSEAAAIEAYRMEPASPADAPAQAASPTETASTEPEAA